MSNEYEWHAKIISRNRITIPDMVIKQWNLQEGDMIQIIAKRFTKPMRDVII